MAKLVGGFATSHGPLLSTPPDAWHLRAAADRTNARHAFRGGTYDYDALLAARAPGFAAAITDAEKSRRYEACQRALDELTRRFRDARADVAIVLGNDQREVFHDELTGAFTVFTGATIANRPHTADEQAKMPPGIAIADHGYVPPQTVEYAGAPEIAGAIVRSLIEQEFDIATSARLPDRHGEPAGIPHAFGFVYRRLMEDAPPPSVPIFSNLGNPPNEPRVARVLKFGHAVKRAIDDLPGDLRVAVVASGGLSHFVIDEELDRRWLDAMRDGDEAALAGVGESAFMGNSCEVKSWYVLAAMMADWGRPMDLIDYVPCYRTPAGTGNAMGFAHWE